MTREWKYPTAFSSWGDDEAAAIARVVASGRFTMGHEVEAFESEFAAYHGMRHCIMVNSGSSANLLMVSALRHLGFIDAGGLAIVPALAWSTTYAPLIQHGLELLLVDCDETWNASELRGAGGRIDLFVGCSILGNPAWLEGWTKFATTHGAVFIEDNCESLGASVGGKLCGTFGLMSSSSFFYSHQISAIEGGAILTNSDECAKVCRMLRAHGWTRDVEVPTSFDKEYDFQVFGYNVRPLELHAAIAREQLRKLPAFIEARLANLRLFNTLTMDLPIVRPAWVGDPSPFGLHFQLKDASRRPVLVQALRTAGIDCRLPTGGSFTQHSYGKAWAGQKTPNADRIHGAGLFCGNAPFDISEQIAEAVRIMMEVL